MMYSKICRKTVDILAIITGSLLIGVLSLSMLNILLRNVFAVSWLIIDVIIKLMFVWMIFIGATVVYFHLDHLKMDFFSRKFSKRAKKLLELISALFSLGLFGVMGVYGVNVMMIRMTIPFESYKAIPTGYLYLSVPVCAVIMILFTIDHLFRLFKYGTVDEPVLVSEEELHRLEKEVEKGIEELKTMETESGDAYDKRN